MRIGYAKLGRSLRLAPDSWGQVGGDNEPPILLNKLARRHPQHEFVIVGRTNDEDADMTALGFPPNVSQRWTAEVRDGLRVALADEKDLQRIGQVTVDTTRWMFEDLDGLVVWAGQHGTTNSCIPKVGQPDVLTSPQISFVHYGSYLIHGINHWRDADPLTRVESWLMPDVRNYLKARDLKWPPAPILGQYDYTKNEKHYRYGDVTDPAVFGAEWDEPNVWRTTHRYVYSQLEVVGIPSSVQVSYEWEGRSHFGILINEASKNIKRNTRLDAMRKWVVPLTPAWVGGTWSDESKRELGWDIKPIPWGQTWDYVRAVRSTFTTPSSGSGWATTKPWEAFAVGTVCFFHPAYDDQGHVIPTLKQVHAGQVDHDPNLKALAQWLRPRTPEDLKKAVDLVDSDRDTWLWLVQQQRALYDRAVVEQRCMSMIEARCGLAQ